MKPLSFSFLIWPIFFKALSNYQVTELSKINTATLCNHQQADRKTSAWPGPETNEFTEQRSLTTWSHISLGTVNNQDWKDGEATA